MKKKQKWIIEIEIDNSWIADGFDINEDNIIDKIQWWLPYAYSHEIKAKILQSPDKKIIRKLQGY